MEMTSPGYCESSRARCDAGHTTFIEIPHASGLSGIIESLEWLL